MALIALDCDVPDERSIDRFMRSVRERYPYPTRGAKELTAREVLKAAEHGAEFGVERWDAPAEDLERIEEGGRIDLEQYGGADRFERELPTLARELARFRFGTVGPSNHFVELQRVEEILDPVAAEVLGICEGQLSLQYHAGGGLLTGQVGRLFARRQKMHGSLQLEMALARPLGHLASARSIEQVKQRLALYFRPGCPTIPLHGREGERVMLANAAAMNYGFAFRAATYATLVSLARELLGASSSRLVVDSPHNSIYQEDVGGAPAIVHRHNSCRAWPAQRMRPGTAFGTVGQAVLLPGTHRTSSYLCVAGDQAERSLYSACHGAGTVIDKFATEGRSEHAPSSTLRYRYDSDTPSTVGHLDDRGVDAALRILVGHGLVRPVARMRPVAVLN
jgi:RNA-splicing ligase RtcB